jgi:FAD/FMN-containing dehydrogenase
MGTRGTVTDLAAAVDTRALARELSRELRGEVRFSPGSRALYANDGSVYRQLPLGVVIPKDAPDVVAAVEICRRVGRPSALAAAGRDSRARRSTKP